MDGAALFCFLNLFCLFENENDQSRRYWRRQGLSQRHCNHEELAATKTILDIDCASRSLLINQSSQLRQSSLHIFAIERDLVLRGALPLNYHPVKDCHIRGIKSLYGVIEFAHRLRVAQPLLPASGWR
ncbi:hypothetical protein VNO77_11202 [Canavalia gladiata]|uniref:Uncharacterized protein n=1 Tax=Canavalia gladiata TaxID=3824 RepID=A0AAN9QV61_CANGL